MGKKYKFHGDDYWMLVIGAILLVFSVMLFLAARGQEQLMIYVMTGLGVVGVIVGFLLGAFVGVGVAVAVLWGIVKLMEIFTIPAAILFLAGAIGMIVWWLKECIVVDGGSSRSSTSKSEPVSGSGSSVSSASSSSKTSEPRWEDYKDRTDYEEMVIDSSHSDGQYVAFMLLTVGTRVKSAYYTSDDTSGLIANGKHLHTFNKEQEKMIYRLLPDAIFVSDIKHTNGGSYTVTLRCYKN